MLNKINKISNFIEEFLEKTSTNNQLPILSSTMSGIFIQGEYFNRQTASDDTTGYKVVPRGYFTYRSMSDTGGFTFNQQNVVEKGIVSPAYPVFKIVNMDEKFFYYFVNNSKFFLRQLNDIKQGGTRFALPLSRFSDLKISYPDLTKQKGIGAFLSAIDRLIEKQKEKVDRLKVMKSWYLKQMFPADGEDKPKLRFKNLHSKWKLIQLGHFGSFTSNGVDKTINPNETPVFLLNYMDVYKRRKLNLQNYTQLMRVTATQKKILENNVLKGDVFFTPTSETPDDIGRVHVIEETLPNTVYSYHLMRYRPIKEKFALLFPNYVFDTINFRKKLFLLAKGVQRFVISKPDFESLKIEMPEFLEQEKISAFLGSIDHLIEKEEVAIEHYESLKKEYLKKIFAD
jgi:type I restriction enzyme S subunit